MGTFVHVGRAVCWCCCCGKHACLVWGRKNESFPRRASTGRRRKTTWWTWAWEISLLIGFRLAWLALICRDAGARINQVIGALSIEWKCQSSPQRVATAAVENLMKRKKDWSHTQIFSTIFPSPNRVSEFSKMDFRVFSLRRASSRASAHIFIRFHAAFPDNRASREEKINSVPKPVVVGWFSRLSHFSASVVARAPVAFKENNFKEGQFLSFLSFSFEFSISAMSESTNETTRIPADAWESSRRKIIAKYIEQESSEKLCAGAVERVQSDDESDFGMKWSREEAKKVETEIQSV